LPKLFFCGNFIAEIKSFRETKIKMSNVKKIKELESLIYSLELELKKTKVIMGELTGEKGKKAVDYTLRAGELNQDDENENGVVVEGDILKLTIDRSGAFIFKQISPVDRSRLVGRLVKDNNLGEFVVLAGDKIYRILMASITYFKGEEGDEVVILAPKDHDGTWAAVENVIKSKKNKFDEVEIDF
jgi:hypothetical protein